MCGDLTDYGLADEARILAKDLTPINIPVVCVLGNHDFEAGEEAEISKILTDVGVHMLDGDTWEFHGIGFAGVRGFCGGFGRGALGPWGEKIINDFVHEAVQEALKLESALARLKSDHRIVLMHYAPIRATVEGESPEIFPFLGSSRLEDPIAGSMLRRCSTDMRTRARLRVRRKPEFPYSTSRTRCSKANYPDRPPFRLFERCRPRRRPIKR